MYRKLLKFFVRLGIAGVILFSLPFIWRLLIVVSYGRFIYPADSVPAQRVAIVYGAGIYGDGRPSAALQDRLDVAIDLYKSGKVERLLVSGDNSFENYNEPGVMINYAREKGVPFEHIQPDYGGRRTYDSCYRAKNIFQLEKAILITQEFHMPRALFLCRWMGIEATGVTADLQSYALIRWFQLREVGATAQAPLDLIRNNPAPIMGRPIVIE
ncbi:MAG: vancomycin high temperature exclusion protein [Anaerolineae bacterium]